MTEYVRPKSWQNTRREAAEKRQNEHANRTLKEWKKEVESRRGNSAKEMAKISNLMEKFSPDAKICDTWDKSKKAKQDE